MYTVMTKGKVDEILKKHKVDHLFYLGNGARGKISEIHLKIDRKTDLRNKEFALQFEKESGAIAIWDIRERINLNASLDLYAQNSMKWEDVDTIYIQEIAIGKRNSDIISKLALMTFSQLEDFLKVNSFFEFEIEVDNRDLDAEGVQSINVLSTEEGKSIAFYGERYERQKALREAAIKIHGYTCSVCGFDYSKFYGLIGKDYIEVHHLKPLNLGKQTPDPKTDMISVCANCHRMIHRKKYETLTPDELKNMIRDAKNNH